MVKTGSILAAPLVAILIASFIGSIVSMVVPPKFELFGQGGAPFFVNNNTVAWGPASPLWAASLIEQPYPQGCEDPYFLDSFPWFAKLKNQAVTTKISPAVACDVRPRRPFQVPASSSALPLSALERAASLTVHRAPAQKLVVVGLCTHIHYGDKEEMDEITNALRFTADGVTGLVVHIVSASGVPSYAFASLSSTTTSYF